MAQSSRAGSIANRATTVPQGTLIPAVLETAMNSTGAGFARALVQRDVHGFDGTRVLIPRGSASSVNMLATPVRARSVRS